MASQELALHPDVKGTNIETLLAKKGHLAVKVFHVIGEAPCAYGASITISTLRLFEPGNEQFCSDGIRAEFGERDSEQTHITFLDLEEVNSVVKAIDYMCDLMARCRTFRGDYTEVAFSTKGNFGVGFFAGGDSRLSAFVKCDYRTVFVDVTSLRYIGDLLRAGQSHLNSAQAVPMITECR